MTPLLERGGVIVSCGGARRFVSADTVKKVVAPGPITPVAGLPPPALGIALADGRVVTVLLADAPLQLVTGTHRPPGAALLCDIDGDFVLVVVDAVLDAGLFAAAKAGVRHGDADVEELFVGELRGQLEGAIWAARARTLASLRAAISTDVTDLVPPEGAS